MKNIIFIGLAINMILASCSKKTEDVAPVLGKARLEISPSASSTLIEGMLKFEVKMYDEKNQEASISDVEWLSSDPTIASINQEGIATGISIGQVEIIAKVNNLEAMALLTVVENSDNIATVTLTPAIQEMELHDHKTLLAEARNIEGEVIPNAVFTWQSDDNSIAEINPKTGEIHAKSFGTTWVSATSEGIQSAAAEIQVIRKGSFTGRSFGTVKLKIENGQLKVQTESDFGGNSAPDLRIYLSNSPSNVSNSIEIATLSQRTGAQSWNILAGTQITTYRYVLVWCKQFSQNYGTADLGEL